MAHSSAGDDYADYTDPFSLYGKAIIEEHHDSLRRLYSQRPPPQLPDGLTDVISRALADPSAPASEDSSPILSCSKSAKIGIIGAGVGGLYAAMMLQSLGIDFEILEASERVGGRLYTQTYGFSQNKYDYFVRKTSRLIFSLSASLTSCSLAHRTWAPCVFPTHP